MLYIHYHTVKLLQQKTSWRTSVACIPAPLDEFSLVPAPATIHTHTRIHSINEQFPGEAGRLLSLESYEVTPVPSMESHPGPHLFFMHWLTPEASYIISKLSRKTQSNHNNHPHPHCFFIHHWTPEGRGIAPFMPTLTPASAASEPSR